MKVVSFSLAHSWIWTPVCQYRWNQDLISISRSKWRLVIRSQGQSVIWTSNCGLTSGFAHTTCLLSRPHFNVHKHHLTDQRFYPDSITDRITPVWIPTLYGWIWFKRGKYLHRLLNRVFESPSIHVVSFKRKNSPSIANILEIPTVLILVCSTYTILCQVTQNLIH